MRRHRAWWPKMASLNRKIVAQAILAPNGGAAISSVRINEKTEKPMVWTSRSKWVCVPCLEPLVGFEPTTPRLQITCSGQLS